MPTLSEAGVQSYHSTGWNGLYAPRGVAKPIVDKLNATLVAAMNQPDTREQMERQGAEPVSSTPAAFASFVREEWNRYGPVIRAAGLKIE